jgi:hypothetical protein
VGLCPLRHWVNHALVRDHVEPSRPLRPVDLSGDAINGREWRGKPLPPTVRAIGIERDLKKAVVPRTSAPVLDLTRIGGLVHPGHVWMFSWNLRRSCRYSLSGGVFPPGRLDDFSPEEKVSTIPS